MAPNHTNPKDSHPLLRASVLLGLAVLVFLQLLVTFRGLKSPDAMEQAVIARELARGEGLSTKVIRPYALRQQSDAGKPLEVLSQPNTLQPPLPSFLLAPLFKALEPHWENASKARVYVLDRVIGTLSLLFFIAAMGLTYLTAQRLFDDRIANWTLLIIAGCQLLWNVALTSLAPMMLLFFFSACVFLLVVMDERISDERSGNAWIVLLIGICFACMVFTHWRALWLLPGLCFATARLLKSRSLAIMVALPVIPLLVLWCLRNQELTNDFLGVSKSIFQSVFGTQSGEIVQRDYEITNPILNAKLITRSFIYQSQHQLTHLYEYLGSALPAVLFFLALLHPFKRSETSGLRIGLILMWLGAFLGMSLFGVSRDDSHEKQLHHLFIPIFSAYGLAFLFVLWQRLPIGQGMGWIARHGIAILACLISSLPMLTSLPDEINSGINARGMQPQWPPYLPDSFALLRPILQPNELLAADIPWAIAWYSDRSSLWLPKDRLQLEQIQALVGQKDAKVAGILLSPYSAKADSTINDALRNQYSEWSEHLYLAVQSWHSDNQATLNQNFPFREVVPLYGTIGISGRLLMEMILFTDAVHQKELMRVRTAPPPTATPSPESGEQAPPQPSSPGTTTTPAPTSEP